MNNRSIIIILSVIILIFSLSSCFASPDIIRDENSGIIGVDVTDKNDLAIEVLRCLDEDDAEALKSLFCEKVMNSADIDEQIAEGFEFYEGKMISRDEHIGSGGSDSYRDGRCIYRYILPTLYDVVTDSGEKYDIWINSYPIYEEKPQLIGIHHIEIIRERDDAVCTIGQKQR